MNESFRQDRDNNTPPDFDDPHEVKLAWQLKLRKRWEAAAEKPSLAIDIPLEDPSRWWTRVEGIPPHEEAERIKRQLRRYER
jgi:hypothetical protein